MLFFQRKSSRRYKTQQGGLGNGGNEQGRDGEGLGNGGDEQGWRTKISLSLSHVKAEAIYKVQPKPKPLQEFQGKNPSKYTMEAKGKT